MSTFSLSLLVVSFVPLFTLFLCIHLYYLILSSFSCHCFPDPTETEVRMKVLPLALGTSSSSGVLLYLPTVISQLGQEGKRWTLFSVG